MNEAITCGSEEVYVFIKRAFVILNNTLLVSLPRFLPNQSQKRKWTFIQCLLQNTILLYHKKRNFKIHRPTFWILIQFHWIRKMSRLRPPETWNWSHSSESPVVLNELWEGEKKWDVALVLKSSWFDYERLYFITCFWALLETG